MIQDAFVRQRARQLYWQGYPPAEISRLMGINPNTCDAEAILNHGGMCRMVRTRFSFALAKYAT